MHNIIKVEETISRALSLSPRAIYTANLFLKPLPNPMSRLLIQRSTELIVSHTPFSYSPRQANVSGTNKNCTKADHPFIKKDAIIFFLISKLRLLPFE